jgi:hydrogenase maturation protein HypF
MRFNLPASQPSIFAAGAELKNNFLCLTRDRYAFVSHFIGDLENYETLTSFEEGIQHYEKLFRIGQKSSPAICTRLPGQQICPPAREAEGLPLVEVQHHHAHLAACLAENHWPDSSEKVIGVCFDGTGLGTDGAIWGGEFLVGNYREFARPGTLRIPHCRAATQPRASRQDGSGALEQRRNRLG